MDKVNLAIYNVLCVCVCLQVKGKSQDVPRDPEAEVAKMEKLLSLLRDPEQNTA